MMESRLTEKGGPAGVYPACADSVGVLCPLALGSYVEVLSYRVPHTVLTYNFGWALKS